MSHLQSKLDVSGAEFKANVSFMEAYVEKLRTVERANCCRAKGSRTCLMRAHLFLSFRLLRVTAWTATPTARAPAATLL